MKATIICLFTLMFLGLTAYAQPEKGAYLLGGSLGFGFSDRPGETTSFRSSSFYISPRIGKFVSPKYLIHGGVGYGRLFSSYEVDETNWSKQSNNRFSLSFGATRFIPINEKLFFTMSGSVSPIYELSNLESEFSQSVVNNRETTVRGVVAVSPGLTYFLNENWLLSASIGLVNYEVGYNLDTKIIEQSVYARASANSFVIGARYMFGSRKK